MKDTSRKRACQKDVDAGSLVVALGQAEICSYYTACQSVCSIQGERMIAVLVPDPAVVCDLSTVLENFMYSKGYNENNVCGNLVCRLS